jgi:hypothetical protein
VNRVDANARADAVAQTERAREQRTQNDARHDHQATLYRGHTNFTHAHRAHAKLLANKLRANKLRARLAQARKTRAARRGKFTASRKTNAPVLRHAHGHASALRGQLHRGASGARVTRDGGRGGGQQGQGGQQQQRDERQQQRRERSWRRGIGEAAGSVASVSMLAHSIDAHDTLADACCDALLSLRDKLAANPHARIDSAILRLAREATAARLASDAPHAMGLEAIVTRLAERSNQHAQASPRLAHFNLLAGLHLLMMERPLRASNTARSDNTLAALEARHPQGISGTHGAHIARGEK